MSHGGLGTGVWVGVGVAVGAGVGVGVGARVGVGAGVELGVSAGVGVALGVELGVVLGPWLGVGRADGPMVGLDVPTPGLGGAGVRAGLRIGAVEGTSVSEATRPDGLATELDTGANEFVVTIGWAVGLALTTPGSLPSDGRAGPRGHPTTVRPETARMRSAKPVSRTSR